MRHKKRSYCEPWVQSAKWPLKMTRKQANRRLFREQWPRRRYKGQKGEGVLWTKRTLEWRIQPTELRRNTQRNSFPKAWPLWGHRSTKLKEGRKFMDFWVWWVLLAQPSFMPTCTCCSASMAPNSTQTWPLSPLDLVSLSIFFFFSWLFIPEVSAGYFPVGFISQRLVQGPYWGLSLCSRIKLYSSSRISEHLLVKLISAATRIQRKHSSIRSWVRSNCREIAIVNQPRIQSLNNRFIEATEAFPSETANFHAECLWRVKGPLNTIFCLHTHTHTHTHKKTAWKLQAKL